MESNVAQLPLSDKLWGWFETNRKPVAWGVGVVAVAGLAIWFLLWQQDVKQVEAGDALSSVVAGQFAATGQRPDPVNAYLKVAATYPNSSAGAQALLLAAGGLFTDGKYPEAQAQFERFTREHRDSPFMAEALLGIAACLDAEGKSDQAIKAYTDLVARHPNENVVPEARFALGRLYEAQGKPELARDQYELIERAFPFTALGNEAGVRQEELSLKYPKLGPAPPIPTNAPIRIQKR